MSNPSPEGETYFRFEDYLESVGGYDILGEWVSNGSRTIIRLCAYPVIRRTPKGAWIRVHGEPRFICNHWVKRYALPSVEEAKRSFIKRKQRQASIYEARASTAREAINLMNQNKIRGLPWISSPVPEAGAPNTSPT